MSVSLLLPGDPATYGNYLRAVEAAGGRVCFRPEETEDGGCDGLILPGGGDLEPWRYGQADRACRDTDPARDAAELALLARFAAAGKPVLGICRGMQVINVFFGGTLCQDLPGHSAVAGRDRLHFVRAAAGTFGALWGPSCVVNSAHHQCADRLGSGLEAVQWAGGCVEALRHVSLPVLAVQWHPERLRGDFARREAADGDRLFSHFLGLCADRKKREESIFSA